MARQMNSFEKEGLKAFNEQLENSFGLTAKRKRGRKDGMGFTWFEVFKNGETTGYQYDALDEAHAIRMYKQTNK